MRTLIIGLLRLYKEAVSPYLPPACRFTPTCSEYAMDAVRLHGVFKGMGLAIWRILRCHPLCKGGYDPVPEPSPASYQTLSTNSLQSPTKQELTNPHGK